MSTADDGAAAPLPTPASLPIPGPIKPTSRARTYRIPNTDGAASGLVGGTANAAAADGAAPESFLWATREIAALDFLMNVPLNSEKDIVRAGLSGGRWHRHHADHAPASGNPQTSFAQVIDEGAKNLAVPPATRNLSNFDVTRSSGIDEEATATGTESLISEHSKHPIIAGGRWWDKLVLKDKRFFSAANQQVQRRVQLEEEEKELERPTESPSLVMINSAAPSGNSEVDGTQKKMVTATPSSAAAPAGVPGRRLDGREAISVAVPEEFRMRPLPARAVARHAAVREWEIRTAYGERQSARNETRQTGLLDGRAFFSTKRSYPVGVFSLIKYEPKKEETLRRRKQLEELGGGGQIFVLPERDWRGISYRALLPQAEKPSKAFNRLLAGNTSPRDRRSKKRKATSPRNIDISSSGEDSDDDSFSSSDDSTSGAYYPGYLDDPQMVQGRNRNVMMGDKVTGPIISSTIQFVQPSVLKADLNKQFRERFDQYEPPKSQRKYIGARVIDGVYTLIDPTETMQEDDDVVEGGRVRSGSITAEHERETIRMPPSLTLSKIRSLKQQALVACVRARIEISTLALACVYFERLCLDCRVDKSNRRLSFAACLLLAAKINESNSMIAYDRTVETKSDGSELPLMTSWIKPNKKSGKIFESLIVFFTHDWNLSLKQLYAAEWIVFSSLGFSLRAKPSEVAFHFKRLLRVLEWNPRSYLGSEMYRQWKDSLVEEAHQKERRKARREARMQRNERKLLRLQQRLHMQQTEESSSRSSRRTSMTISDGGASQDGKLGLTRRHSVDSVSVVSGRRPSDHPEHSQSAHQGSTPHLDSPGRFRRKPEGVAIRGLLSRLSRPRHVSHKELDKLPKLLETKSAAPMKQSHSTPNLTSLVKKDSVVVDFSIEGIEEDDASCHSENRKGDIEEGLFI
ncbi:hypothetical protein ACHAXT_010090 [Thalassiosira profunda]